MRPRIQSTARVQMQMEHVPQLVLFADMLGFGTLSEKGDAFIDVTFDVIDLLRPLTDHVTVAKRRRQDWFIGFHSAVTQITLRERKRLGNHSVISFSDSVFITGAELGVLKCASALMRLCIWKHIPVRMGLGWGSWIELHFGSSMFPARRQHAAQFYGSGVTSAYHAEHKGGKGLRIFVHPGAAKQLGASKHIIPLPPGEETALATHEVNYGRRTHQGRLGELRTLQNLKDTVKEMSGGAKKEVAHYIATQSALNRMEADIDKRR